MVDGEGRVVARVFQPIGQRVAVRVRGGNRASDDVSPRSAVLRQRAGGRGAAERRLGVAGHHRATGVAGCGLARAIPVGVGHPGLQVLAHVRFHQVIGGGGRPADVGEGPRRCGSPQRPGQPRPGGLCPSGHSRGSMTHETHTTTGTKNGARPPSAPRRERLSRWWSPCRI